MERVVEGNVNVYLEELKKKNVNVTTEKAKRKIKRDTENRFVARIMASLGPVAKKDESYWHKVARTLSEDQIELGIEIAAKKKPAGIERVRYIGGIYHNMMKAQERF